MIPNRASDVKLTYKLFGKVFMKPFRILIVIVSLVGAVFLLHAQNGQEKVWLEQSHSLHKKVLDLFQRAESAVSLPPRESLSLQEEILAVSKLLHRLEEESERSNVDGVRKGKQDSRTPLLIAHGAKADDLVLAFLSSWLSTKNPEFLVFAKAARSVPEKIDGLL